MERVLTADAHAADAIVTAVTARSATVAHRPLVIGLCGAQGSGKSTLADVVAAQLNDAGVAAAILSLDDLYKTKAQRIAMAAQVHPLFRTRGVPGTHDIPLGADVLAALRDGRATALPRFDKAVDDRVDPSLWPISPPRLQILIFEGWFVGATPQPDAALTEPVNALERDEDGDGRWRRYANAALADYRTLFSYIDLLVLLAAPSFDVVRGWRTEQEQVLRRRSGSGMSDDEVGRFVDHYERLTRHVRHAMPLYADLVIRLGEYRNVREIVAKP